VRLAFEAAYKALARFFDSEHWLLDDEESQALGEPAALLLQRFLPIWFARWAESNAGALDLLFAMAIINAPRITEQLEISRERRSGVGKEKRKPGERPRPVTQQRGGPVGPIDTNIPIIPIDQEG
jgi:hypothetical protein